MIDSDIMGCPQQKSAGCHFGTFGRSFFKGKNKMAARYFKIKYVFSTNEARNKFNTSFSCDFDWAIHVLYYVYESSLFLRSQSLFQGQISKNTLFNQ